MKLLLKVLLGGAVLLTVAFAQEPKHAVVPQEPVAFGRVHNADDRIGPTAATCAPG